MAASSYSFDSLKLNYLRFYLLLFIYEHCRVHLFNHTVHKEISQERTKTLSLLLFPLLYILEDLNK